MNPFYRQKIKSQDVYGHTAIVDRARIQNKLSVSKSLHTFCLKSLLDWSDIWYMSFLRSTQTMLFSYNASREKKHLLKSPKTLQSPKKCGWEQTLLVVTTSLHFRKDQSQILCLFIEALPLWCSSSNGISLLVMWRPFPKSSHTL